MFDTGLRSSPALCSSPPEAANDASKEILFDQALCYPTVEFLGCASWSDRQLECFQENMSIIQGAVAAFRAKLDHEFEPRMTLLLAHDETAPLPFGAPTELFEAGRCIRDAAWGLRQSLDWMERDYAFPGLVGSYLDRTSALARASYEELLKAQKIDPAPPTSLLKRALSLACSAYYCDDEFLSPFVRRLREEALAETCHRRLIDLGASI